MAATAFPPQNKKAAISPCKHFCLCQGHPLSSAERSGSQIKKSAECRTKDMTKAERKRLKKKSDVCRQGWLWAKAKPPMNIFPNGFAFDHCHARFFSIAGVQLLAWPLVGTHKQKCAAHRFYLVACRRMPSAGRHVRWPCGRLHLRGVISTGGTSSLLPSVPRCLSVDTVLLSSGFCDLQKPELP